MRLRARWLAAVLALGISFGALGAEDKPKPTRFAVIGDFGTNDASEAAVERMVKGWQPEFIMTVGDNSYVDREKNDSGFKLGVVDHFGSFIKSKEEDPTGEK